MNTTTFGLDIAKRTFQMYWVEAETGEIVNRRFTKQQLIEFLGQRTTARVALEACGSAHWWARKIAALGHEVVLLHARFNSRTTPRIRKITQHKTLPRRARIRTGATDRLRR